VRLLDSILPRWLRAARVGDSPDRHVVNGHLRTSREATSRRAVHECDMDGPIVEGMPADAIDALERVDAESRT
jgi:hypothetical protein